MAKKNTGSEVTETPVERPVQKDSGIVVNDAALQSGVLRQVPLVITLPADASKAQIEFAKVLNAYAVCQPDKWQKKKAYLLKQLEDKKTAPDPVSNPNVRLSVGPKVPDGIN